MNKIINPCKVKYENNADVFINIKFNDKRLSITGVIGPMKNGDAKGGCGQIDMSLRDYYKNKIILSNGWNLKMYNNLLNIWSRWHLNDLTAGTPLQEKWLRHDKKLGETWKYPYGYDENCRALKYGNIYNDDGYKYGHAWLFEEVPNDIIRWLFSLPDSEKIPAWV